MNQDQQTRLFDRLNRIAAEGPVKEDKHQVRARELLRECGDYFARHPFINPPLAQKIQEWRLSE